MDFSLKAQEIHDHIVNVGKADEWVGIAKRYIKGKSQYEAGPPYTYDVPGLRERLKADLAGAVHGADDSHWEEIAKWLIELARPK